MDDFVLLPSKVVSVTVFRSGARVTRSCEIARGEAGFAQAVSVSNLPLSMEDGSVRVRVETSEDTEPPVMRDYRVVLGTVKGAFLPLSSLENKLRSADREVSKSEKLLEKWNGFKRALLLSRIKGRPAGRRGEPPIESPVENRLLWLDFKRNRLRALENRIAKQRAAHLALIEQRDALKAELNEASDAHAPRATELRKMILLTLDSGRASSKTATVYIDYLVPGAGWAPCYSLSLKQASGEVSLSLRAAVSQRTGEDWTGVSVSLSTALPRRFSALPELMTLRVGKRQQKAERRQLRPVPSVEFLYADYDAAISRIRAKAPQPAKEAALKSSAPQFAPPSGGALQKPPSGPVSSPIPLPVRSAAPMPPPPSPASPASGSFALPQISSDAVALAAPRSRRVSPPPLMIADAPPESALDTSLLDFGNLRMGGPSAALRGKVAPMSVEERYLDLLAFQQVEINVNITQVIQAAIRRAEKVERLPPLICGDKINRQIGFDCIYKGDHTSDIPSDGQLHTISLKQAGASANLRYISVPRESMQVFRCLTFSNPFPFPLLPGKVEVTSDGRVLPPGEIDATPKGGEAELWIGAEQRIKISRNANFEEESLGLLRGQTSLLHSIDFKLINHLPHSADIEVRERIPVAKEGEDDVKVAIKKVEPTWHSFEQRKRPLKGGYAWTISLKPNEERHLVAEYTVTIPAKHQLVGGNRREV